MKAIILLTLFTTLFTTGCSFKMPMNPTEFKKMIPDSIFGKTDSYTANSSLKKIKRTFKQKTNKCFRKSVKRTSCVTHQYGGRSCSTTINHYNPQLKSSKNKLQLTLQVKVEGNAIILGGTPPKGGMYTLVADLSSVKRNKTKVDLYYGWSGSDMFVKTIKRWTSGKTRGCPDLTQN